MTWLPPDTGYPRPVGPAVRHCTPCAVSWSGGHRCWHCGRVGGIGQLDERSLHSEDKSHHHATTYHEPLDGKDHL